MARTAKLSGNGAGLFPEGVQSLQEVPWDLAQALDHAYKICSWQENLISTEMPPPWMWPFDTELELWFEEVDRERNDKYGGSSGGDEEVPLMGNEVDKERFGR